MLDQDSQDNIQRALFRPLEVIANSGAMGPHRDHILALLALKYLWDRARHAEMTSSDTQDVALQRQLLASLFDRSHHDQSHTDLDSNIDDAIDQALAKLGEQIPLMGGVSQAISFVSPTLGPRPERVRVLASLLNCFRVPELNFSGDAAQAASAVAFACEFLIKEAAEITGKRGNDFFTPPELSTLIARLVQPRAGESVCDPCCGSGTLLMTCSQLAREQSGHDACHLYGQEKSGSTWALAKINLLLHGEQSAHIAWGDTLRDPQLIEAGRLQTFDVVVASPPFNLKDWGYEAALKESEDKPAFRYRWGMPPRAAGDYAFISHMVSTLDPDKGRMAVVVSLGVLSRSGAEQQIREQLLRENLIDAVIALPAKLFAHTNIPVALLVLRKQKPDRQVVFVDASRQYAPGKTQNTLLEEDSAIEKACQTRQDVGGFARVISVDDLLVNQGNLSVARYVEIAETVDSVDLTALRSERAELKAELAALEEQLAALLEEADLG